MTVGVLALQGSFNEHIAALRRLGVQGIEIRKAEQLLTVSSLIIPGGESTTMAKLAEYHNLFPALREFVKTGKPVWGTCAGLIFLADRAVGQKEGGQELVGGLDCTVHRNFFGSQIQSFEADISVPILTSKEGGPETYRGVFIRAPAVLDVGPDVEVLAHYPVPSNKVLYSSSTVQIQEEDALLETNVIVAVKQRNLLATAFHPELTADTRWHSYFMKMAKEMEQGASSSSGGTIVSVGDTSVGTEQAKPDIPIYQKGLAYTPSNFFFTGRKTNCNGYGSLCYDPRFVGGDGRMFYFHGSKGGNFAIVSDNNLHINAHFIGTRPVGRTRDFTWVQALNVMFESHKLVITANKVTQWDENTDAFTIRYNDQLITLPEDEQSEWRANSGQREIVIERTDERNSVRVLVSGLVQMDIKVRPIGKEEDRVHNYQLPQDDAFAHLETQFKFLDLSELVEGVLGKTYRPDYVSTAKTGVPMPVMGGEDKYQTPSLFSPTCRLCRFKPQEQPLSADI
ncbi:hypothetical protein DY000_02018130 [Brassica cretica]|uniref:Glutaminase n=2 Tax=Brassica cretica TaxID=69181 RepID=A0ABQ7D652_BRACR|nr:hypothetical protein DY000_02018130 [Brassica cretica]